MVQEEGLGGVERAELQILHLDGIRRMVVYPHIELDHGAQQIDTGFIDRNAHRHRHLAGQQHGVAGGQLRRRPVGERLQDAVGVQRHRGIVRLGGLDDLFVDGDGAVLPVGVVDIGIGVGMVGADLQAAEIDDVLGGQRSRGRLDILLAGRIGVLLVDLVDDLSVIVGQDHQQVVEGIALLRRSGLRLDTGLEAVQAEAQVTPAMLLFGDGLPRAARHEEDRRQNPYYASPQLHQSKVMSSTTSSC